MLKLLRWGIVLILLLGLPIFVYLAFIADEPVMPVEDDLAMGKTNAHAERRHSSLRLQKEYGKQRLLELFALGTPVSLGNVVFAAILNDLTNLRYSRAQEAESDRLSVAYLADSRYACDGAAGFFDKIVSEGDDAAIPASLSDHPDSEARVRDIRSAADAAGCSTAIGDQSAWREFQATLRAAQ